MIIRKLVRELNLRFEERIEFLQKEYQESLKELQDRCDHNVTTKWSYKLDDYGELAANVEGIPYRYQECLHCGFVDTKLDNINDYDAEITF